MANISYEVNNRIVKAINTISKMGLSKEPFQQLFLDIRSYAVEIDNSLAQVEELIESEREKKKVEGMKKRLEALKQQMEELEGKINMENDQRSLNDEGSV